MRAALGSPRFTDRRTSLRGIAMSLRIATLTVVTAALAGSVACSPGATGPSAPATALVSVAPTGGAANVNTGAAVVITFSHAMASGMEIYVSLHKGDVTGPTVPGIMTWSADRMMLTFTPDAPMDSAAVYTLHIGGGMRDADGHPIDMTANGMMGGQWATGTMMTGGGMMGGGVMGGPEMGPGWMGGNGMYGMVYTFTTA